MQTEMNGTSVTAASDWCLEEIWPILIFGLEDYYWCHSHVISPGQSTLPVFNGIFDKIRIGLLFILQCTGKTKFTPHASAPIYRFSLELVLYELNYVVKVVGKSWNDRLYVRAHHQGQANVNNLRCGSHSL